MRFRKEFLFEWDSEDSENQVRASASYQEINANGKAGIQEVHSCASINEAIEWGKEFFERAVTKQLTPGFMNATEAQATGVN
jgi:hypothetical protein